METTIIVELSPNREIEYQLSGSSEKKTVVFVHGLSANMKQFAEQHECFNQEYQVLSFSLPGHGRSGISDSISDEFGLEKLGENALKLFDQLGMEKVHFVGNSAGGLVGLQILKDHPERLLSLTTFGTTPVLHSPWLLEKSMLLDDQFPGHEGYGQSGTQNIFQTELPRSINLVAEMMAEADKNAVLASDQSHRSVMIIWM